MYASVRYELRESDFHEIRRTYEDPRKVEAAWRGDKICRIANEGGRDLYPISGGVRIRKVGVAGRKQRSHSLLLKQKRATTLILKQFDPDRPPVIVVYSSKWAVSAALLQKHEDV